MAAISVHTYFDVFPQRLIKGKNPECRSKIIM